MENKIIIPYVKPRGEEGTGTIRVSAECARYLSKKSAETGLSVSKIASTIIMEAADFVQFVELNGGED